MTPPQISEPALEWWWQRESSATIESPLPSLTHTLHQFRNSRDSALSIFIFIIVYIFVSIYAAFVLTFGVYFDKRAAEAVAIGERVRPGISTLVQIKFLWIARVASEVQFAQKVGHSSIFSHLERVIVAKQFIFYFKIIVDVLAE